MVNRSGAVRLFLLILICISSMARAGEYWVLEDPSGQLSSADVISQDALFEPITDPGIGLSRSAFWLKIAKNNPTNQSLTQTLLFHSHALVSNPASISVFDASGETIPSNEWRLPSFNVDVPAGQTVHLYARIQSNADINLDHIVVAKADAQHAIMVHTRLYLALLGALLALFAYNLISAAINRSQSSTYYCIFLFFGATTIAIDANLLAGVERQWIGATGTTVLIAGIAFLCSLLELPRRWMRPLNGALFLLLIFHWLAPTQLSFSIFLTVSSPVLLLLTTALILFAWFQDSPYKAWVSMAWVSLISGSLGTLAATHGYLNSDFLPSYAIGNVFESLIFASTLAFRLKLSDRRNTLLLNRLTHEHETDSVTGLPNRIALEAWVDKTNENVTAQEDYAAAIVKLDNIGNIRKAYSNSVSDHLTQHIGQQLISAVGDLGKACILDRDTLFVIGPARSMDDLEMHTDKLEHAAGDAFIEVDGLTFSSTVSIGACFWTTGEKLETVLPVLESLVADAQSSAARKIKTLSNLIDKDLEILDAPTVRSSLNQDRIKFHLSPVFNVNLKRSAIHCFVATLHWDQAGARQTKSDSWDRALNQILETPGMGDELHQLREKAIQTIADNRETYVVWNVSLSSLQNPDALESLINSLQLLQQRYSIDQAIQISAHDLSLVRDADNLPSAAIETLKRAGIGVGLTSFGIEPRSLECLAALRLDFVQLSSEIYSIYKKTPLLIRCISLLCDQYNVELIAPDVTSPVTARRLRASGVTLQQGKLYQMPQKKPVTPS